MAIFAKVDKAGDFVAFYDTALHPEVPKGAFEITVEQWQDCVSNIGRRRWEDGEVVEYAPPPEEAKASPIISPGDFRARFTVDERRALTLAGYKGLAADDATIQTFLDDLPTRRVVDLESDEVSAWMDAVVTAKVVTKKRATAIMKA